MPLDDIQRVVPLPLLTAPVAAPHFVEGIFNLQGTPVAVIKLDRILDTEEEPLGLYSPLLVLKGEDPAIALHVSRTNTIISVLEDDLQALDDDETLNGCVLGCFNHQGETVYVLARSKVLLGAERERIAALDAMREHRLSALEYEAQP